MDYTVQTHVVQKIAVFKQIREVFKEKSFESYFVNYLLRITVDPWTCLSHGEANVSKLHCHFLPTSGQVCNFPSEADLRFFSLSCFLFMLMLKMNWFIHSSNGKEFRAATPIAS